MINSLFSNFDPTSGVLSLLWAVLVFSILILPGFFWVGGLFISCMFLFVSGVNGEMGFILPYLNKGEYLFISSIFTSILLFNVLAVFPFFFSVTSQLLFTLPVAYSLWLGVITFSWANSLVDFLAHLVPSGTPIALISFIALVELLSSLIRPLALTFRLTANMIAGHLLISIIGSGLISFSFGFMLLGALFQFLLAGIELGVCLVQSYVFVTLLVLYMSEGNS